MLAIAVDRGEVEGSSTGGRLAVDGIGQQIFVIQRAGPWPASLQEQDAAKR